MGTGSATTLLFIMSFFNDVCTLERNPSWLPFAPRYVMACNDRHRVDVINWKRREACGLMSYKAEFLDVRCVLDMNK